MVNPWIEHIRKYAKDNNITYACAVTKASATYTKNKDVKKEVDVVEKNKNKPVWISSKILYKSIKENKDPNQTEKTYHGFGYYQKPFNNESKMVTENRNNAIFEWTKK